MDRHDANKEEEEKEKKKECGTRHSSEHTAVLHEDDENKRSIGCVTREGSALMNQMKRMNIDTHIKGLVASRTD